MSDRKYQPREEFEVVVYDDKGEKIGEGTVSARNKYQATADAILKTNLNFDISRVTVDDEETYPFKETKTGKGFKRFGTCNSWVRMPVDLVRTIRRLLPDRAKGAFITDAIIEKLERDKEALRNHTTKYQVPHQLAPKKNGANKHALVDS
jgi:hypothetical protein